MKGGVRKGAGRPKKKIEEKAKYTIKTIKFKEEEKFIIEYIESYDGKNFSDKLKKVILENFEKK